MPPATNEIIVLNQRDELDNANYAQICMPSLDLLAGFAIVFNYPQLRGCKGFRFNGIHRITGAIIITHERVNLAESSLVAARHSYTYALYGLLINGNLGVV